MQTLQSLGTQVTNVMLVQEKVVPPEIDKWLKLPWDGVVVHYHEIGLKGGNRRPFTKALVKNLQRASVSYTHLTLPTNREV